MKTAETSEDAQDSGGHLLKDGMGGGIEVVAIILNGCASAHYLFRASLTKRPWHFMSNHHVWHSADA